VLRRRRTVQGVTLIELMIGITVLGILIMIGLPAMGHWLQNTQIRTHAETTFSGLQLARSEALKRNSSVRFQFVESLTTGCVLTPLGKSWVVSLGDPAGLCAEEPSETGAMIIQKKDGAEGSPNTVLESSASVIVFNGLGRMTGGGTLTVNITNPAGGVCGTVPGQMRCMRVVVSSGGQVRMCDPQVTDATDPRICP
jgi:type IV fimbrial biogenesis protein FimT